MTVPQRKYLRVFAALLFLSALNGPFSFASHLIGDEFTYQYLGDTTIGKATFQKYQVTLNIYTSQGIN